MALTGETPANRAQPSLFTGQATNGSDYRQTRGCEATRAEGQGFASEKTDFGAIHVQSGTD
ncbi:MAG: hypothetical protein IKS45_03250, partial [Thermoguttaceae bacterium]|nr:hypothetical protein [Thermoguttaceae bacterium]